MARRKKSDGIELSKKSIIDAALSLVVNDSLDALTTKAIGQALGVSQPAVYHHYSNRDALVLDVVDTICNDIADKIENVEGEHWTEAVPMFVDIYSEMFSKYSGVAGHLQTYGPYMRGAQRLAELWMKVFVRSGFSHKDSAMYVFQFNHYVFGFFSWHDTSANIGPKRKNNSPLSLLSPDDYGDVPLALVFDRETSEINPFDRLKQGIELITKGIEKSNPS